METPVTYVVKKVIMTALNMAAVSFKLKRLATSVKNR